MSLPASHTPRRNRPRSVTTPALKQPAALTSGLAILITTILFLLAFFSLRSSQQQAKVSENSLKKLEQEIQGLESDLERSRQATANNQSDLAREKVIRNELLGQKPGEIILQVPERERQQQKQTLETTLNSLDEWKKLLF